LEPVVAPVLETRPIAGVVFDLEGVDALAFTSLAGVAAFANLTARRDLVVYAVGDATCAAARSAGFAKAHSAGGDVAALAERIAAAKPRPRRLLNPTAREPAADLPSLLAAHGIEATALAVYETVEVGPDAAPPNIDAVLVHSPKAARRIAGLIAPTAAQALDLIALSQAAAKPLSDLPFRRILTPPTPDETALMALLKASYP
jgi:uroporphyrinogen-III synthase